MLAAREMLVDLGIAVPETLEQGRAVVLHQLVAERWAEQLVFWPLAERRLPLAAWPLWVRHLWQVVVCKMGKVLSCQSDDPALRTSHRSHMLLVPAS